MSIGVPPGVAGDPLRVDHLTAHNMLAPVVDNHEARIQVLELLPPGPQGPQGPAGPEGPTAVSADAGNVATLGADSLVFVPALVPPIVLTAPAPDVVPLTLAGAPGQTAHLLELQDDTGATALHVDGGALTARSPDGTITGLGPSLSTTRPGDAFPTWVADPGLGMAWGDGTYPPGSANPGSLTLTRGGPGNAKLILTPVFSGVDGNNAGLHFDLGPSAAYTTPLSWTYLYGTGGIAATASAGLVGAGTFLFEGAGQGGDGYFGVTYFGMPSAQSGGPSYPSLRLYPNPAQTADALQVFVTPATALGGFDAAGRLFQGGGNPNGYGPSGSFGGGTGPMMFLGDATSEPTTDPVAGGIIYVTGGALTYRGPAGTVTILAPA